MRSFLIGCVVALIAASPAAAKYRHGYTHVSHRVNYTYRFYYASCTCSYGNPERICTPTVSCYNEGGRCTARCPAQTGNF
jgi:hypothetical protein